MRTVSRFSDDRVLGALGVLLGVILFVLTPVMVQESTALVPGTDILLIRGTFYPSVTAILISLTGLWLLFSEIRRRRTGREVVDWPARAVSVRETLSGFMFLVVVACYVAGVAYLGFAITSVLAFAVIARWLGARSFWAGLLAIVAAGIIEGVFGGFFNVPLPRGPLP